ncbi:NADH-quinone oxidoreductase subunit NuoE [Natranaerobius thermophilus]|uniref:NADH dehydrogenase (Ubiquinone) 24 kDa subunit n=1 Tax=Natranaerobius thermophilus (strain ATCC BAA-1301 / DSM 18059 / JW/NM-WN-LF) TaxID=457570 RepID=B2A7A0_NATTJ|nr:NADH-quinone oxidoreductase subunit NuoE [Natranaerobius thermophilus]ACB84294.1 NADH dehydrogenase (ubiquinone) 24 kDa subunit [Natranaerobius thermophilus JW/NM-WN-LF]
MSQSQDTKQDTAKRIDTQVRREELPKEELRELIRKHRKDSGGLIPLLQTVQEREGYLSRKRLESIAREMNLSLAKIMGVVSFYSQFHIQPKGKNIIRVCMGTACHVKGAGQVMEKFQRELSIETGQTTEDREFSLEAVSCIGACGLAPVLTINHNTHGKVTTSDVNHLINRYVNGSNNGNEGGEQG